MARRCCSSTRTAAQPASDPRPADEGACRTRAAHALHRPRCASCTSASAYRRFWSSAAAASISRPPNACTAWRTHRISDATAAAKALARPADPLPPPALRRIRRTLLADRFSAYPEGSGSERLAVSELGFLCIGDERVDVRGLHDIVNGRQLTALGFLLRHLAAHNTDCRLDIAQRIDELYSEIEENGLDTVVSRAISRPADASSTCPARPSCSRFWRACG